jgi:ribosomal-protein-alanine N-acetyltransferase
MIEIIAIAKTHLPDVQRYASDPSIGATSNVPSPYPPDGATRWFLMVAGRIASGTSQVFAVTFAQKFCGGVTLNDIDRKTGTAQVDYWIAVPFQRKGIATRAVKLLISRAKSTLRLLEIRSFCLTTNTPSAKTLERNEFKEYERSTIASGKFHSCEIQRFRRTDA